MSRYFATITFLIILVASTAAQDEAVNIKTDLVTMNVGVTDKQGRSIRGLSREDFSVTDNGVKQEIDVFSANDAALSIGIVFDMHNADARASSVLEALKRFSSRLGPNDDYFVTVFNEKGSVTAEFVPDLDQVRRHLSDPEEGSPRSLYDAIIAAGDKVRALKNPKKYLIVVSDGADRTSEHSVKDLKQRLQSVDLPLYVLMFRPDDRRNYGYIDLLRDGPRQAFQVGEGTELDRSVLTELSGATGGQVYESDITNRVYLTTLASKFLDEARSQYVIGFYPESNDGRWRKLRVAVNGEKQRCLSVASRKGYRSRRQ